MFGFTDLIHFVLRRKRLVALLAVFNLIVSIFALLWVLKKHYRAEVQVSFNEVKYTFEGNLATDYLFEDKEPYNQQYAFINILQADSLMRLTVLKYQLADHFELAPSIPDRDKKAIEILRRSVMFTIDRMSSDPVLKLTFSDRDPEVAENVLLDLVNRVAHFREQQIEDNNAVTLQLAEQRLQYITGKLPDWQQEIHDLPTLHPGTSLNMSPAEHHFEAKVVQKLQLADIVQRLSELKSAPKYKPYSIANNGSMDASLSPLIVVLLALFANLLALITETQLLFMLSTLKRIAKREPEP